MKDTNGSIWEIKNEIGDQSGFGQVFEAKKIIGEEIQEEDYAIKILSKLDDDSVKRFKREVKYLTKLNHPRIVKSEGYFLNEEPYFYAMKKYKTSLQNVLSELTTDYKRLKLVFNHIFDGVEYLHNEGYYHRDLKPANILYNSDNDIVLCDLGLCNNPLLDDTTRLTVTNMGGGTRFYCSPEQEIDLKHVDQRTDIYSLGKIIYEVFTLETPQFLDYTKLPSALHYVVRTSVKENKDNRFDSVEVLRIYFNSALDLLIDDTDKDELLSLINEVNNLHENDFVSTESHSNIDKLAYQLGQIQDEENFHETIMKMSGKSFKFLENNYLDLCKKLILDFIEEVTSQSWPFSYTDTLANKFEDIFINISDIEVKSEILKTLLSLGTGHNRWYVMEKFISLLETIKSDEEAYYIYHVMMSMSSDLKIVNGAIHFDKNIMAPVLKKLFVFE